MHLRKILLLGISLIAVSIITAKTPLFISNQPQDEMDAWVDSVYNSMTPEQRVGQLIAQSFQSKDVNAAKRQIKSTVENTISGGHTLPTARLSTTPNSQTTSTASHRHRLPSLSTANGDCRCACPTLRVFLKT